MSVQGRRYAPALPLLVVEPALEDVLHIPERSCNLAFPDRLQDRIADTEVRTGLTCDDHLDAGRVDSVSREHIRDLVRNRAFDDAENEPAGRLACDDLDDRLVPAAQRLPDFEELRPDVNRRRSERVDEELVGLPVDVRRDVREVVEDVLHATLHDGSTASAHHAPLPSPSLSRFVFPRRARSKPRPTRSLPRARTPAARRPPA